MTTTNEQMRVAYEGMYGSGGWGRYADAVDLDDYRGFSAEVAVAAVIADVDRGVTPSDGGPEQIRADHAEMGEVHDEVVFTVLAS